MRRPHRTLQVFEHQRLVVGQTYRDLEGGEIAFDQRLFERLCAFNDAHEGRYYQIGHRSIRFRQYVGLLQIGPVGIEILPKVHRHGKADPTTWREVLLMMIGMVSRLRSVATHRAVQQSRKVRLLDVFAAAYLDEVQRLLRHGLRRGYKAVEENRRRYRGRLLVTENVRRNFVHAERFYVAYQRFDFDTPANRILRAALGVLDRMPLSAPLRQRLLEATSVFPEVEPGHVDEDTFRRLRLDRSSGYYRGAIELARMILLHYAPSLRWGGEPLVAMLFDMNVLFEEFVAALLQRSAPEGWTVDAQPSRVFWRSEGARALLRPDIVVRGPLGDAVVVDTKWKVPKGGRPSAADLRQMYAYHHRFDAPRTVLLYPRADRAQAGTQGVFFDDELRCEAALVSLTRGREADRTVIAQELLRLVGA